MDTLERCCLITLRFESDAGARMAVCGCFSVAGLRSTMDTAFAHPIFASLDDSGRFERVARSLERSMLAEAGVACSALRVKEESFVVDQREEPVASLWIELDLAGKINARKVRVIETALRGWLDLAFPGSHCPLPAARPIPTGTDVDMGALRAGWRAEAAARGFSAAAPAESMPSTPEDAFGASGGADAAGFPGDAKARRRK